MGVLDEKSNPTLEQSINHIVNLYKYRDVQVLKLENSDSEIKTQNQTRNSLIQSGDYLTDKRFREIISEVQKNLITQIDRRFVQAVKLQLQAQLNAIITYENSTSTE